VQEALALLGVEEAVETVEALSGGAGQA